MTNGERIDQLARALAAPNTRRRAVLTGLGLVGGAGVIAAWRQPASSAQSTCITAGNPCSLGATCCDGSYCASTSLFNPNVGVCTQGSAPESPDPAPTPTKAPRPPKPTRPAKTPGPLADAKVRLRCFTSTDDQDKIVIENAGDTDLNVIEVTGIPAGEVAQLVSQDANTPLQTLRAGRQMVICVDDELTDNCTMLWNIDRDFFSKNGEARRHGVKVLTDLDSTPVEVRCNDQLIKTRAEKKRR